MDPAFLSAFAALAGSALGVLASVVTSSRAQQAQLRGQNMARRKAALEDLYGDFIDEAARLRAHALAHDVPETADFVGLYAKISKMRFLSSPIVVSSAEAVARGIVETYSAPNKTVLELKDKMHDPTVDLLRGFSETCRAELHDLSFVPVQRERSASTSRANAGVGWRRLA